MHRNLWELCGHQDPCPVGPGQSVRTNMLYEIFSCREKKKPEFFWPRKILPARAIRIFFQKSRIAPKVHAGRKYYQSDVHPIIG
jgi:hypothetical protein